MQSAGQSLINLQLQILKEPKVLTSQIFSFTAHLEVATPYTAWVVVFILLAYDSWSDLVLPDCLRP